MEVVHNFSEELQSLLEVKPPVSKAKMVQITRAAMKGVKYYKHIVQTVEKFIARSRAEYKVPGLYVIDSIVRQSRHQFGAERDVYAPRFSRNLSMTFENLFTGCGPDDKPKIVRVLNLWLKNEVFNFQVIQPLLDMANPNASLKPEPSRSADSPGTSDASQRPQSSKHNFGDANNSSRQQKAYNMSRTRTEGGLKFSRTMLDFDYDEDDDDGDETPTEAEPPLSSTLNRIGLEQRSAPHEPSQPHDQQSQSNFSDQHFTARNEQDPVLERWNKLMKQNNSLNDSLNNQTEDRSQRTRSRSPPQRTETCPNPRAPTQSRTAQPSGSLAERKAERQRKCLPDIRDKHLTVCSTTLWLGHVPKTVSEADISNAFGEYGTITSIDLIPPRGCAYVCMDRRQDAKRALTDSKDLKLNGSHIKIAWAPGKGFKEYKKLKDFWDADSGCSFIPYGKIDSSINFDVLEEGGEIDEDSMSMEMRAMRQRKEREKEDNTKGIVQPGLALPLPSLPILSQPPPFIPPPTSLNIPPPNVLAASAGMAVIPFPPPIVASVSNPMPQPSQSSLNQSETHEKDNSEGSPNLLDQQLKLTERQINMVEQQLSMIQQAHNNQHPPHLAPPIHPSAIFPQTQPNPMMFEMIPPQMLHAPPMMDPQHMQMFANPPPMMVQAPLLPINQPGVNQNMNGNQMHPFGGPY